ncbi:MAG: hypothetical protein Q4F23_06020 [Coriobacteriia bacterium]|nr:hypothetical protein [Coriobacteriia bacterium]
MAASDAQLRANENYRKKHVRQTLVRFYPAETDLWEHLQAQPNKAGYIKELIRRDMKGMGPTRQPEARD